VEHYIKCYSALYGLKYTVLRYANVYGPRQDPFGEAGVVAIFIGKMLKNEPVFIFGDGKQLRDYVYVKDVVSANLKALTKGNNEIINIGTHKTFSVNQLEKELAQITNYKNKPIYKPKRSGELLKSFLNISKAKKVLNWQPETNIKTGLKNTVEFFKKQK
jgi:UDP-glucose 4-epimerase